MKPLWTHTLAWIVAAAVAVLFAMFGPESGGLLPPHVDLPFGTLAR